MKTPRPPARLILSTPEHLIAFGFGAGLAPAAPGTAGTLVGLPLFALLALLPLQAFATTVAVLFLFGCWVCGRSAKLLGVHDYGGIVFDEIVGYLVAASPLLLFDVQGMAVWAGGMAAAFLLFRLFDILKPWPIAVLDRQVGGGFGIMLDDLLAGVLAALPVWAGLRVLAVW